MSKATKTISVAIAIAFAMTTFAQTPPATQPQTPPGMLPYTAILEPKFVPAGDAGFLGDDYIVLGVAREAWERRQAGGR